MEFIDCACRVGGLRKSIVEEYPDDSPYPSYLMCRIVRGRPLHVVGAYDKEEGVIIVVTTYEPDPDRWEDSYTKRRP